MENTKNTVKEYFAAANSYDGFKSYFPAVFDPKKYDGIYILKGGPGTGKNSIMRAIHDELRDKCDGTEMIYCSSDVKSLDGIVLRRKEKKVAIIDGTAPHTVEPKYPGAVEKIINLGDGWNEKMLKLHRDKIIKLNDLKKKSYDSAYKYLKISKLINESIDDIVQRIFKFTPSERIRELVPKKCNISFTKNEMLIEAFGCNGFQKLKTANSQNTYYVVGLYGSERIFYRQLIERLESQGISYLRYSSALDNKESVGLYLPETDTKIINYDGLSINCEQIIDTSRFLDQIELSKEKNSLEFLYRERETMLWNSVSEFKSASNYHFELEKIYTSSMDFTVIDKTKGKILAGIKRTLKIKG